MKYNFKNLSDASSPSYLNDEDDSEEPGISGEDGEPGPARFSYLFSDLVLHTCLIVPICAKGTAQCPRVPTS